MFYIIIRIKVIALNALSAYMCDWNIIINLRYQNK